MGAFWSLLTATMVRSFHAGDVLDSAAERDIAVDIFSQFGAYNKKRTRE
jgi:hypothetical protein